MYKTSKEWENLFKSHEAYPEWLNNLGDRYDDFHDDSKISWSGFIGSSFAWLYTPQGYDFWRNLANNQPNFEEEIYYV